ARVSFARERCDRSLCIATIEANAILVRDRCQEQRSSRIAALCEVSRRARVEGSRGGDSGGDRAIGRDYRLREGEGSSPVTLEDLPKLIRVGAAVADELLGRVGRDHFVEDRLLLRHLAQDPA